MTFLRRLLGRAERREEAGTTPDAALTAEAAPVAVALPEPPRPSRPALPLLTCPYCAIVLDPPPARNRLCPGCRRPIIVRRVEGRLVLLVDAALPVFERERLRTADEQRWTIERQQWLKLAEGVHAAATRRSRLAKADPSAASVDAARDLYMAGAERIVRAARRRKGWSEVAMIRRAQAAALYREAGAVVPPPDTVVDLHRDGLLAELRSLAEFSGHAELVSSRCCRACRADDGRVFSIAAELRAPRLPHDGCPKGICGCEWWLAIVDPNPPAKRRRKPPTRPPAPPPEEAPTVPAGEGGP